MGNIFGWDKPRKRSGSYIDRLSPKQAADSLTPPGTKDGAFQIIYALERESVAEILNATVHAFLVSALVPTDDGYRLYWAVYVKPISWLTPLYMAVIEPFRRFVVYPSIMRRIKRAWTERYASNE